MEYMQKQSSPKQTQNSSAKKTTIQLLTEAGFKHVQKQGSILMPLSKKQRESMKK